MTVKEVWKAIAPGARGSRRFLVADEVGLGKTVVARTVIDRWMASEGRKLNVLYITSGQAIAEQNRKSLIGKGSADQAEDRLSLLATAPPNRATLRLYALTPLTSFPAVARGGRGRVAERSLLALLLRKLGEADDLVDRYVSAETWSSNVRHWKRRYSPVLSRKKLPSAFYRALCSLLQTNDPMPLLRKLRGEKGGPGRCLHIMRGALTLAALRRKDVQPDLIILDEFQKFPWFLPTTAAQPGSKRKREEVDPITARLINELLTDERHRPALLLLSATPYRLRNDKQGDSHREFYRLMAFLAGGGKVGDDLADGLASDFGSLRRHLFSLGGLEAKERERLRVPTDEIIDRLERSLRKCMARTERSDQLNLKQSTPSPPLSTSLIPADVAVFDDFASRIRQSLHKKVQGASTAASDAVPQWRSVPYPMQTLGSSYQTWRVARSASDRPLAAGCSLPSPGGVPGRRHPKIRPLIELLEQDAGSRLPWLPPTLPWWQLGTKWSEAAHGAGKLLVFSEYRASPGAIGTILSQTFEAELRGRSASYKQLWKKARFRDPGTKANPALYCLFFPWPAFLNIEPLKGSGATQVQARDHARAQIERLLPSGWLGNRRGKPRPLWKLVCQVTNVSALTDEVARASGVSKHNNSLKDSLRQWKAASTAQGSPPHSKDSGPSFSNAELNLLAEFALAAPGVVLARAFLRHWRDGNDARSLGALFGISWFGLRQYMGCRLFDAVLAPASTRTKRRRVKEDQQTLLRAIIEGNLESALDETFAMMRGNSSSKVSEVLSALRQSMRLHVGRTQLQKKPGEGAPARSGRERTVPHRAHLAVPFQIAEAEDALPGGSDKPLHQDVLRRAFNSPFWPHTLVTTSVGQEGLDFHVWCDRLLHWDLPSSPIALEQREGRINRFSGLAIRRVLAEDRVQLLDQCPPHASPWAAMFDGQITLPTIEKEPSGLSPWWVLKDARPTSLVIELPLSHQGARLQRLREDLLLYRLALGQPDIQRFVAKARSTLRPEDVDRYILDLSPLQLRSARRAKTRLGESIGAVAAE